MMLTKYVQNLILSKKDYFALILLKMEKRLVNIFQQKANGVIRQEVLEQEHWIYTTLMQ